MRIDFKLLDKNGFAVECQEDCVDIYPKGHNQEMFHQIQDVVKTYTSMDDARDVEQLADKLVHKIFAEEVFSLIRKSS